MRTSLDAARRGRELDALDAGAEVVDVLVVGLGVTGAGAALDAASRGLSVVAVDAHDLAFGTSRWSSKLVHGGLRYLAGGQVGVAWASMTERRVLLERVIPHLVRPLPMLMPVHGRERRARTTLTAAGLVTAELMSRAAGTSRATLPRPRRVTAAEAARLAPALRRADLRGGWMSWDGQLVDDVRLVVALARTAAGLGARVLTRCRVLELTGHGARIRDEKLTGRSIDVRARAVVNAAGVWAGGLVDGVALRPSRGTHLVLPAAALGHPAAALTVPIGGSLARYVFALPQPDGLVYVGITDEPVDGPVPDVPAPTEAEIAMLLDVLNGALAVPVRRADVLGAFAGLRPLLAAGTAAGADVSRRHAVLTSPDGVVTVVGGKLTTYRAMAQDAVDAALAVAGIDAPPSRTRGLPLVGSGPAPAGAPVRLVERYGAEAGEVAGCGPDPLAPLAPRCADHARRAAVGGPPRGRPGRGRPARPADPGGPGARPPGAGRGGRPGGAGRGLAHAPSLKVTAPR